MNIDQILEALQAIIDGAKNEDGSDRPLTDDEAQRYKDLEGQLVMVRQTDEIRSRHRAYTAPAGPGYQTAGASAGDQDNLELRAIVEYLTTGTVTTPELRQLSSGGTGAEGGYVLPPGFRNKIIEKLVSFGGIMGAAEVITTPTGNPLPWPTLDDTDPAGAQLVPEHGAIPVGDIEFDTDSLGAYKYASDIIKASWEFIQDTSGGPVGSVENFLLTRLCRRISRVSAGHFATGTGTNQPEGLVTGLASGGTIASNAAGPTYGELLALTTAVDEEYIANASFVMNRATWAVLLGITDDVGRPLLQANAEAGMANGVPRRLLGFPVVIDQGMPAIGDTTKPIVFGDIRQAYVIRMVKDCTLVRLNELYAANGQVGFLTWARMDAKVQDPNAAVVMTAENTA
jgi:HK97 family phage major capsid protein